MSDGGAGAAGSAAAPSTAGAAIALPARLTMAEATATLAQLAPALAAQRAESPDAAATLDASALVDLDTAALAVLLECRRLALDGGRPLAIAAAPDKLVRLAQLYGVDELLGLDDTVTAGEGARASTGSAVS